MVKRLVLEGDLKIIELTAEDTPGPITDQRVLKIIRIHEVLEQIDGEFKII